MLWNRTRLDKFDAWEGRVGNAICCSQGISRYRKMTLSLANTRCSITFYYLYVYSKRLQLRINQIREDKSSPLN